MAIQIASAVATAASIQESTLAQGIVTQASMQAAAIQAMQKSEQEATVNGAKQATRAVEETTQVGAG